MAQRAPSVKSAVVAAAFARCRGRAIAPLDAPALRAPDTPAFLYALSTALSLHELQITKTGARTAEGNAVDEINVVDRNGQPLSDPDAIQQLRRSVLLTLQFAYFLDKSPDPFTALQRFDELSRQIVQMPRPGQWLEVLGNPLTMTDLAKAAGASNFLWEDFIRFKADALLPIFQRRVRGQEFCPTPASLPRRLEQALAGIKDFEQQRLRLNEFKDRELFLIDLDHILAEENPDSAFQILSERLVFLAENLVAAACGMVHAELVRLYGKPRNARRAPVGFAVLGLGKLGGVALGYASDIELLFVFDSDGATSGGTRGSLDNGEFFSILTRETGHSILAKREGIFQVDLRLRPFGTSGPLAISKRDFAQYYGPDGQSHEFERLALARLRWIAGDSKLGFEIERLRDQLLYEGPPLDPKPVWEISGKMRDQHAEGRKLNSKHSPGRWPISSKPFSSCKSCTPRRPRSFARRDSTKPCTPCAALPFFAPGNSMACSWPINSCAGLSTRSACSGARRATCSCRRRIPRNWSTSPAECDTSPRMTAAPRSCATSSATPPACAGSCAIDSESNKKAPGRYH